MAHLTPTAARLAAWLADESDSAVNRAVSNPASLGIGTDLIGFGGGQPAAELYPLEALQRAFSKAILEDGRDVLPYGPSEGLPALREIIAERLGRKRGIKVGKENVLVTTGSMQGLHLVGRVLLDHGDTIVTEAPTFMGALGTWEHQQPKYLSVRVDEHGMVVADLEAALKRLKVHPKFIYALPTFQNPSGVSLSVERRRRLLELADEYNLFIIEDDPYGEFWFDEGAEPTPPLRSLPGSEERVIYLGTFSKILAPGIRLAYAVATPHMIELLVRAKRGIDFHTDTLVQQGVVRLVRDPQFDLEDHIELGRRTYKARRDATLDALETTFTSEATWTRPTGGYFLWIDLPKGVSGERVAEAALAEGVAVFPGPVFYPNGGGENGIRLSFSNATPERIAEGIRRLQRGVDAIAG